MTKKEIIERLYVLRSILSVISLQVDEVKTKEVEIEEMQRKKESLPGWIDSGKQDLSRIESTFLKHSKRQFNFAVFKLLFFILVFILGFLCAEFFQGIAEIEVNFFQAYAISILFGFLVIITIPDVIKKYGIYKKNKDDCKNIISNIKYNQEYLKDLEFNLSYLEVKLQETIVTSRPVVEYFYNAAKQLFDYSGFLNERAWQYIDLLIYAFEVMQKDTMKEALEYVQMQVNHNELVRAIQAASIRISDTIERSVAVLRSDMNNYYNQLSKQIAGGFQVINNDIASLNNEFKEGKLLMKKINTSSQALMDDLDYAINKIKYS